MSEEIARLSWQIERNVFIWVRLLQRFGNISAYNSLIAKDKN